jgi:hypothetical protein
MVETKKKTNKNTTITGKVMKFLVTCFVVCADSFGTSWIAILYKYKKEKEKYV